jgi:hypothetical protein
VGVTILKEIFLKHFFFLVFLLPMLALSATFPSKESARTDEHCKSEWTKRGQLDQQMYNFCVKQQNDGYAEALILIEKYKDQPWIQEAINFSIAKWSKAGIRQDRMVKFSIKKIVDGWEDMVYESKQPSYNKAKHQSCQSKWAVQLDMVAHCYKQ